MANTMRLTRHPLARLGLLLILAAGCTPSETSGEVFQATPPTVIVQAPVYTVTPTRTPIPTATPTPLPTDTPIPSETPSPTLTLTASPTIDASPTPSDTPGPTLTPSPTPIPTETETPAPTQPPTLDQAQAAAPPRIIITPTAPLPLGAPAAVSLAPVAESTAEGWTCGDFPCQDEAAAWLDRLRVPDGFVVEAVGTFPGQVMQIVYGRDGRLYATVLEDGTRSGAVYAMNPDGTTARYSGTIGSPLGLAFQPGTDHLYVSGRIADDVGAVWRVPAGGGDPIPLVTTLPCCLSLIDNQPAGMIFGRDGYLYLGVASVSDTTANPPGVNPAFRDLLPYEASVVRIDPTNGLLGVYADGMRYPFDLALDSVGRLYASDRGLLEGGLGDRVLRLEYGGDYGFPYWGGRGCTTCPIRSGGANVLGDLVTLTPGVMPAGMVTYSGTQFPVNLFDTLFVALWNSTAGGQRIVQIDPQRAGEEGYQPVTFMTGLIRPTDLAVAPDGSLVVADYVYGQIWRVRYTG